MSARSRKLASAATTRTLVPSPSPIHLRPRLASVLPFGLALLLAAFVVFEDVRTNPRLAWSFVGTAVALATWNFLVQAAAGRQRRVLGLEVVLRPQHYVQACTHLAIFAYWGWYWPDVYRAAHLIASQLVFAYAFDMILVWSRRDVYTVGFGPLPIIFSTNLFLWFKPDWFYLQFLMVAVGFAGKALIRWKKDGRRVHIFNPSSFSLGLFSLALIAAGATDTTWGQEIAVTQFYPPKMHLFLFVIALPGQYLFGVTTMTVSAVVTMYLFGLAYHAATGVYFFFDSYIPIAVFLGMHLLFTDPSTSPRTELGRIIFGFLYALAVIALYHVFLLSGVPPFYDKLLPVPVLNLCVRALDRAAKSRHLRRLDPTMIAPNLLGRRRNLAYIGVWVVVFTMMSAARGVGDTHRGQWLPFWLKACEQNRAGACAYLAGLETIGCRLGSGWSCNELGILEAERRGDRARAAAAFDRACRLGFSAGCDNAASVTSGATLWRTPPTLADYPIILRGSKGPLRDQTPAGLMTRACRQGWPDACVNAGRVP